MTYDLNSKLEFILAMKPIEMLYVVKYRTDTIMNMYNVM